jgi:hypothetical protein
VLVGLHTCLYVVVLDSADTNVSVLPYENRFKITALDCADAAPANSAAIPKLLGDGMVLK